MTTTEKDLARFVRFVRDQIQSGVLNLSIDELFDQWRAQSPSDELYAENVIAINASIDDFTSGDRGTPAGEHSARLKREYGMSEE